MFASACEHLGDPARSERQLEIEWSALRQLGSMKWCEGEVDEATMWPQRQGDWALQRSLRIQARWMRHEALHEAVQVEWLVRRCERQAKANERAHDLAWVPFRLRTTALDAL